MSRSESRKTRYHSTMSKGRFMSILGAAVGMTGLDSTFKDLDDMMASPKGDQKLPFWIKEVDEPTVEIDWDRLKPFPSLYNTLFNPEVYGEKEYFGMIESQKQSNIECMRNKTPGYQIQDNAMANAVTWLWKGFEIPWTGLDHSG